MKNHSFMHGWLQVKNGEIEAVRTEIMQVLNITSREAFRLRLMGKVEPKVSEKEAIEAVFHKYGIKKIWGN